MNIKRLIILLTTSICLTILAIHLTLEATLPAIASESSPRIVVNQIGYTPNAPKTALLVNVNNPGAVELVDSRTKKSILRINPSKATVEPASNQPIQSVDFSSIKQPGSYYLKAGKIQSYPFRIGRDIYQKPFQTMLRTYYLQRCGVAVNDKITGVKHPPCHLRDGLIAHTDAFNKEGKLIPAKGGWHDAGDYGKYVGPTAIAVGRLLNLYEQQSQLFSDRQLSIPESGNRIPDILDEVKIALDWMLTMQRQDGAVYRKLSGKQWPGMTVSPQDDSQPRYIYGISTPETGKFAAVMAMAARIYAPFNQKYSQHCQQAALKAWDYLQTQSQMRVDSFEGDDSGSGNYLFNQIDTDETLKTDNDDRLWAASELYITTGRKQFEESFARYLRELPYGLFEWKDPSPVGMIDYLFTKRQPGQEALRSQIKQKILQRADRLLKGVESNPWRLANQRFIWGSNKMVAEEGITLFYAWRISGQQAYLKAAVDQIDYLLGRNHFNKSFVSSVGVNSVQNVHHRVAQSQRIVIPGLLVGGANNDAPDEVAPRGKGALSYIDDAGSYATNEYAIDYNSSLIGLMGMLMVN